MQYYHGLLTFTSNPFDFGPDHNLVTRPILDPQFMADLIANHQTGGAF